MPIIKVDNVTYSIENSKIIDNISFIGEKDRFISIIGPSGCGKSTLLRIIAGLIKPTSGKIFYNDKEITEPVLGISFVFQDFGLLPWLTNIENVKIGLAKVDMGKEEKDKKAREVFKTFGLEGFEDTYPNMLSGGMRQRVGIARAIVSNPTVLLMDEPFSSLDELTAEALRADIISMLKNVNIAISLVIMITHNVEEAVELSDKIIILSQRPSHIKEIMDVNMGYPRNKHSADFFNAIDHIYNVLTQNL
ncbi:MAG: ABC transporter ATP-binding protein [Candidatus Micrarchaeia archaeon]